MSTRLSTFQLATRLATDPGQAWMAAITTTTDTARRLGTELSEELVAFGEPAVLIETSLASDVERAIGTESTLIVVAHGLGDTEWARLDRARSRLERGGHERVVFVMDELGAARAASHAPNLWSFVASAVYPLGDDEPLDAHAREGRLRALRAAHGLSDDELIAAATTGSAPPSPDVAEWLILVGRTDLLRREGT